MYSAASTWDSTYAAGVAVAPDALDPAHPFVKLAQPILQTAGGFLGPGRTSHPIVGPAGQSLILYHALLGPHRTHASAAPHPDARHAELGRRLAAGQRRSRPVAPRDRAAETG